MDAMPSPLKSGAPRRHAARLLADEGGAEVIEYALILGIVIVVAISTIAAFGTKVLARWSSANGSM